MVQYCKLRLLGMSVLTLGRLHLRRLYRQGVETAEGMAADPNVRRFMLLAWFSGFDYG